LNIFEKKYLTFAVLMVSCYSRTKT